MKSAKQYLIDNMLTIDTGLAFTCGDYDFICKNNFRGITINSGRGVREEFLTKENIVNRIVDLYDMYKSGSKIVNHTPVISVNHVRVKSIITEGLREIKLKEILE